MNELTIGDKLYISSKKAADITGYAKDYVGQLCREGHVEAKMVGRSWYVLETSIREHRFGVTKAKDEIEEPVLPAGSTPEVLEAKESIELNAPVTWQAAKYEMGTPAYILPELKVELIDSKETASGEDTETSETLSDMQSAWQEWFARKQDPLLETEEVQEAREEALHKVESDSGEADSQELPLQPKDNLGEPEDEGVLQIPLQKIEEITPAAATLSTEEEPEIVSINRIRQTEHATPVYTALVKNSERISHHEAVVHEKRSGLFARLLLVLLILATITFTAVASGILEQYIPEYITDNSIFEFLGGTSTYSKDNI